MASKRGEKKIRVIPRWMPEIPPPIYSTAELYVPPSSSLIINEQLEMELVTLYLAIHHNTHARARAQPQANTGANSAASFTANKTLHYMFRYG